MKKRIWKFSGIAALILTIGFSLIQLTTPVVKASGCPETPFPDCVCNLTASTHEVIEGFPGRWYCTYDCVCVWGGGGEPMSIVRDLDVPD